MCIRELIAFLLLCSLFALPAAKAPDAFRKAADSERILSISQAEFVFANQQHMPSSGWKRQTLPMTDFFAAKTPQRGAQRRLWARMTIDSAVLGNGPVALTSDYATERFTVLLNGREIFRNHADPLTQNFASAQPWFVPIPAGVLRAGKNEIVFRLDSDTFWCLGLGRVQIGNTQAIRAIYNRNYVLQFQAPLMINGIIAVIAIAVFCFWMARPKEQALGWLALLGAAWFVRNLHYSLTEAPFGPAFSWEVASNSLFVLTVAFFGFAATFFDLPNRRKLILYIGAAGASMMIGRFILLALGQNDILPHLGTIPLTIFLTGLFVQACWRAPTVENFVMLAATSAAVLGSFHDFGVQSGAWQGTWFALQPLSSMFVFAAFGFAMGRRVLKALVTVENMNVLLEEGIADANIKLRVSEAARRTLEVDNAVNKERERLMMEIHDGIGSNLITALSVAEKKRSSAGTINVLRQSITDLKITVDSLEPIEGHVTSLLANLRHRLEPELTNAGISFDWRVQDAPALTWLDAVGSLHVLRILQESIGNILAHAGAHKIIVECGQMAQGGADGVLITIRDEGRGFDSEAPTQGKGIANMESRAKSVHGTLVCESSVGKGTAVTLWLPLLSIREPRVQI